MKKQLRRGAAAESLPFGELGSFSGLLQPVLAPLLHPRIPRQQTGLLQGSPEFIVHLKQRPGDAMTNRACLPGRPAAFHVDNHIVLLDPTHPKGLQILRDAADGNPIDRAY